MLSKRKYLYWYNILKHLKILLKYIVSYSNPIQQSREYNLKFLPETFIIYLTLYIRTSRKALSAIHSPFSRLLWKREREWREESIVSIPLWIALGAGTLQSLARRRTGRHGFHFAKILRSRDQNHPHSLSWIIDSLGNYLRFCNFN